MKSDLQKMDIGIKICFAIGLIGAIYATFYSESSHWETMYLWVTPVFISLGILEFFRQRINNIEILCIHHHIDFQTNPTLAVKTLYALLYDDNSDKRSKKIVLHILRESLATFTQDNHIALTMVQGGKISDDQYKQLTSIITQLLTQEEDVKTLDREMFTLFYTIMESERKRRIEGKNIFFNWK